MQASLPHTPVRPSFALRSSAFARLPVELGRTRADRHDMHSRFTVLDGIAALVRKRASDRCPFEDGTTGNAMVAGVGDWNSPTWSLSAENCRYALPALAWALVRTNRFETLCGIALAAFLALLAYEVTTRSVGLNVSDVLSSLMRMGCSFVAGAVLARARIVAPRWLSPSAGAPFSCGRCANHCVDILVAGDRTASVPACGPHLLLAISTGRDSPFLEHQPRAVPRNGYPSRFT
jgi:hypothetical protein